MKQAHTVAAADLATVTDSKEKLTALKELYSSSSSISKTQCTTLRQAFGSQEQAELDETASFSIHKDNLVCEVLPLLTKTSGSTYKANEYYKQLMMQTTSAANSKKQQSSTGGSSSSSSNQRKRTVISANLMARSSSTTTDHSAGVLAVVESASLTGSYEPVRSY
jgi:hypothetical protein